MSQPGGADAAGAGQCVCVEREITIRNKEGLHFRPIMQLVEVCARFTAQVKLMCDGREADARSPMELLMLVATQGTRMRLVADGDDAESAAEAIVQLVEAGFNEN